MHRFPRGRGTRGNLRAEGRSDRSLRITAAKSNLPVTLRVPSPSQLEAWLLPKEAAI